MTFGRQVLGELMRHPLNYKVLLVAVAELRDGVFTELGEILPR